MIQKKSPQKEKKKSKMPRQNFTRHFTWKIGFFLYVFCGGRKAERPKKARKSVGIGLKTAGFCI
jgi:hypothetical protein